MINIALFCEGVSENRIITYITERYLGDDVIVDGIYPSVKLSHGRLVQDGYGGWKSVLDHCNEKDFDSALDGHNYLIIQIDTDTCNQVNYDVKTTDDDGKMLPYETIYSRVLERIMRDIPVENRLKYESRIIFAICFNETECWLLPIYYLSNINKCKKTNSCIYTLNQALNSGGIGIPEKAKNTPGAIKTYDKILKGFKPKNIKPCSEFNVGFKKFVEQLDVINSAKLE